jgi:hypothetical protein
MLFKYKIKKSPSFRQEKTDSDTAVIETKTNRKR